jgi:pyruvate/2-oxoglutarate dehydrogenase complex dihydrolipoamide acyltransferase (E2) component
VTGSVEVRMPKLGDTVVEGTIGRWLVAVGDEVAAGYLVAEIETDKVTTEYPVEVGGRVEALVVAEGETVDIGTVIARIATTDDPAADADQAPAPAAARPPAPAGRDLPAGLSAGRRAAARRVERSWSSRPHAAAFALADVGEVVALRDRERDRFRDAHGVDLTLLPFLVGAYGRALGGRPDVGVAVALPDGGLVVPVLRDAARPWAELAPDLADLVARARAGGLGPADVRGGVASVTNVGVFGAEWAAPVLNEGQATILAVGAVRRRPVALPDGVRWRPTVPLSLAYDRHALDEVAAAALLGRVTAELAQATTAGTSTTVGG